MPVALGPGKAAGDGDRGGRTANALWTAEDVGASRVRATRDGRWEGDGVCDCGANGPVRTPMAAVVEGCGDLGAGTPTQYVARWTEVAVVARERGYLTPDVVVSFDDAAAVDAARPGIEDAVRTAIASEEECGEERARERTAALVSRLERRRRHAGEGSKGKRRTVACPTPLREVVEGSIEHEERWNRCAELVAERGLSMKAAALLFATTMFCVTKDLVCHMTRAQLMAMTGIRTPASFAAAVRELMAQSLLSPKDGAPRTSWYLGKGFWGGLLVDENLDTPVAMLARRRKSAAASRGRVVRGGRRPVAWAAKPVEVQGARADTGAENRTSVATGAGATPGPSTGVENRTSGSAQNGRPAMPDADVARRVAVETGARTYARASGDTATGIENRTSGRRGKERVTVAAFAAEELLPNPVGTAIAERLADYYGKRGEHRIARARLRGLAARVRQDIEDGTDAGGLDRGPEPPRRPRVSVARAEPRARDGPVAVGAILNQIGRQLRRGAEA